MNRKTYIIANITLSSATKGLNGESFTFLHLCLVTSLDNRHRLAAVNGKVSNRMSVQVPNALDRQHLALNFYLVTLHDLLDGGANVAHADIDTSLLDTSICGGFARIDEIVVYGVKSDGKGTVDDTAVDVDTKVDLHDILIVDNHFVARIRGVVRRAVVYAETSRETHTGY